MSFTTLETKLLHALVSFEGFVNMAESRDVKDASISLSRDLIRVCKDEAGARDGQWLERIGITHSYLRV